jgi:uncharacterized protein (TIGR03083 family)
MHPLRRPAQKAPAREERRDRPGSPIMTTLADRTIEALRSTNETLAAAVGDLPEEALTGPSGASEWTIAQVLSHLGSGAEIALATLTAAVEGTAAPGPDFNPGVWDRWNAMSPREQADGFLEHDARLVTAYEELTAEQRENVQIKLGFVPVPLSVAAVAGMRLNEAAQHSWDVRVASDPDAVLPEGAAQLIAGHLSGELAFLIGFIGKADALESPAVVQAPEAGIGIVIGDGVALQEQVTDPTATFTGSADAAVRLIGGRLRPGYTPADVSVTGNVTLDDLRRVFPGY